MRFFFLLKHYREIERTKLYDQYRNTCPEQGKEHLVKLELQINNNDIYSVSVSHILYRILTMRKLT